MCGIHGEIDFGGACDRDAAERVHAALASRGPDASGFHRSPDGRALLGHRRLAIVDLTDDANQPMSSPDARYSLVFNGEIYNFRELRAELERSGTQLRTSSDTEVILALYAAEGPDMLKRLRGMFAFAIWDEVEGSLFLARDPHGIKPLYYARTPRGAVFASTLRALMRDGRFSNELSDAAVIHFLAWGHCPEGRPIVEALDELPAGHAARLDAHELKQWAFVDDSPGAQASTESSLTATGDSLASSVAAHVHADVPVALFLSSGIDSALVAHYLAENHAEVGIQAMTLGFDVFRETPSDEVPLAGKIAEICGLRHQTIWLEHQAFGEVVEPALDAMDQPSIDGLNTYWITRCAREAGYKCVMSGVGGDELFGGYSTFGRYASIRRAERYLRYVPGRLAARLLDRWSDARADKLAALLENEPSPAGAYQILRGVWSVAALERLVGDGFGGADSIEQAVLGTSKQLYDDSLSSWSQVSRWESRLYMRNQLLRDSDWASMAHGVELRTPWVDAWLSRELQPHSTFFENHGKSVLLDLVRPEIRELLRQRPKTGFFVPMEAWMRSHVDEISCEQLASVLPAGFTTRFEQLKDRFRRGNLHWSRLWTFAVLERWCRTLGVGVATTSQS